VDRDQIHAAIAQERRRIADLFDSLDEAHLATESLCTGWDVKTMGSHLVGVPADGTVRAMLLGARRGSTAKAIDEMARRRAHWPAAEIAQASGALVIANTGGRRRKPLVGWPKSCAIAVTSESRWDYPSNPIRS
jgi:hypothetical protein